MSSRSLSNQNNSKHSTTLSSPTTFFHLVFPTMLATFSATRIGEAITHVYSGLYLIYRSSRCTTQRILIRLTHRYLAFELRVLYTINRAIQRVLIPSRDYGYENNDRAILLPAFFANHSMDPFTQPLDGSLSIMSPTPRSIAQKVLIGPKRAHRTPSLGRKSDRTSCHIVDDSNMPQLLDEFSVSNGSLDLGHSPGDIRAISGVHSAPRTTVIDLVRVHNDRLLSLAKTSAINNADTNSHSLSLLPGSIRTLPQNAVIGPLTLSHFVPMMLPFLGFVVCIHPYISHERFTYTFR
jgi:hypothetical protein